MDTLFKKGQKAWNKGKLSDIDLTGIIFGYLTVISRAGKRTNSQEYLWNCKCKCGNIVKVRSASLRSERTKSCGCYNQEVKKRIRLDNHLAIKRKIYSRYKYGAITREYDFSLSFEEFISLIKKNCNYCNSEGRNTVRANGLVTEFKANGIDRLDSTKGYSLENCVPCCRDCNRAKMDLSQDKFIELISNIYNHFILK